MEKIITILKNIRPDIDFQSSDAFAEENRLDSLDLIRLVAELEKSFSISISGNDMVPENFESLPAIEKLVQKIQMQDNKR